MKVKPIKFDKTKLNVISAEREVEEVYGYSKNGEMLCCTPASACYSLTVSVNDSAGLPNWIKINNRFVKLTISEFGEE